MKRIWPSRWRFPVTLIGPLALPLALIFVILCCDVKQAWGGTPTTTTLAVTSAGNGVTTVPAGSVITLTAKVQAGSTLVTPGQVDFCDAGATYCTDIHLLATAQLTSAGTAIFKFVPGVGSHSYKAVFLGTNSYASSTSSNSALTVTSTHTGTYPTNTTIAQSGVAGNYTLTATVSALTDAAELAFPTGTVSFLDTSNGNSVLGAAGLTTSAAGLSFFNSSNPGIYGPYTVAVAVAVGDFNGDGIPDLVGVNNPNYPNNPVEGSVTILLGNGDGTFTLPASPAQGYISVGYSPVFVVVGDFNNDGKQDLAVVNSASSTLTILLGNGDGTFAAGTTVATGPIPLAVIVGDFNHDGNADLAVVNSNYVDVGSVTVLLGDGAGNFTATATSPATGKGPNSIAVGDFNGDGIQDLAVSNYDSDYVTVLLGNGDGTFAAAAAPPTSGNTDSIVAADFNGDGKVDLALANEFADSVAVLLGNGDGTFRSAAMPPTGEEPVSIAMGDFNGDGIPDLAVGNGGSAEITVLLGSGNGTFQSAPSLPVFGSALAIGDFNGDGKADLSLATGANTLAVLLAETQTATATATSISPEGTGTHQVEASYPGDNNYNASVSGTTGLTAANVQASLSTTSISFGSEEVGDSTPAQAVTLTNGGTVALAISSIKLTGADTSSFVTSNTCGASLAAGAKCTIGVRFAPAAAGALAAAIALTDNAPSSPQSVALSGAGTTAPIASLSLSATTLSFGSRAVGVSTDAQGVTVTNTSSETLYFSSITLAGADASSFVTSNTCGASIAAGATCTIGVRFVPTAAGALTAAVTLADNTSTSPQSITLTGTGVGGTATFSTTSLSFGTMALGYSTEVQSVSLTNYGTLPLTINSIQLTGANAASFAESNNCGASLISTGGNCNINVRFAPNAVGAASAAVTVTDNAANSPQTIALSGTGVTAQASSLSLSASSLSFGTEAVESSTAAQGVTLINTSNVTLYFSSIALTGADPASFVTSNTCGTSIAAGAQCEIGARFAPTVSGPLTATITLTDSASTSPQTITLTGTGQ